MSAASRFIFSILLIGITLLSSTAVFGHGGSYKPVMGSGGEYFIYMSSVPVTPTAGTKVSMLFFLVDGRTNEPIQEDIKIWIEILGREDQRKVFPSQEFLAQGGAFEFEFTYPEAGFYEIYTRFEGANEPGKIYESEDFLVDVQPVKQQERTSLFIGFITVAFLFGGVSGFLLRRLR